MCNTTSLDDGKTYSVNLDSQTIMRGLKGQCSQFENKLKTTKREKIQWTSKGMKELYTKRNQHAMG